MIHLSEIQPIRIGENKPCAIDSTAIEQGRCRTLTSKSGQRYEEALYWYHCGNAWSDLGFNLRDNL